MSYVLNDFPSIALIYKPVVKICYFVGSSFPTLLSPKLYLLSLDKRKRRIEGREQDRSKSNFFLILFLL